MVFMIKMELGDLNEIPALWQDNLTELLSFPDQAELWKKYPVPLGRGGTGDIFLQRETGYQGWNKENLDFLYITWSASVRNDACGAWPEQQCLTIP